MAKISVTNISYHYEDFYHPVYENINLLIKTDWKLGLIGRNGRGKTTLLKLLSGDLEVSGGTIHMPVEVEYFPYKQEEYELRTKERLEEEIMQMERSAKTSRIWADIGNNQSYGHAGNGRSNGVETYMKQAKRTEARMQENLEQKKALLQNYEEVKALVISQQADIEERCLIEMKEVSFKYESEERWLIKGLNFEINQGERIWIRGGNGAGKSTLLKLINGTLPTNGITYADNLKIATVDQDPNWHRGFVKDGFETTYQNPVYDRFLELCDLFEVSENFLERPLETYSGGELKKVNIAKVLAEENHILLLDEPLNYMDTYFSEQLEKAILTYKPTLVFVEHDRYFGEKIGTKSIRL